MNLSDCKIIVSGGGSGMGRHFALRIAEAGGSAAVGDVNEVGLAETLEAAKGKPGKVHARRLDVSSPGADATGGNGADRGATVSAQQLGQEVMHEHH